MTMLRNWPVHNLFAHPLSELAYWFARPWGVAAATKASEIIHDATLPEHTEG